MQLREKSLDQAHFRQEAAEIRKLCKKYGVPLIINDNVRIAKEIDADGVHVGQGDMEAGQCENCWEQIKSSSVSARTVEQAVLAQQRGADYLGVGAVFPTGTKKDASGVSFETLREICRAVSIPVVAIGGITGENLGALRGSGIGRYRGGQRDFCQRGYRQAAGSLRAKVQEILQG